MNDEELDWQTLPPGIYDAVVGEVNYYFGETIGILIPYEVVLPGGEIYVVSEWLTMEAPKSSPAYVRTAEGKGRVSQILAIKGMSLKDAKAAGGLNALPDLLRGTALRIAIRSKLKNGLSTPVVAGVIGPASTADSASRRPGRQGPPKKQGLAVMTVPVRFGSHAAHVHKNGWLPIVPVYGKSGLERNWPMAGWEPPTREAVQRAALRHPTANIGLVMDGKTVVIDVDQTDLTMSAAVADLAEDVLGYTPFVRVGSPPKWCRFYRADGLVPTTAGGGIEIFSAVGSKQVVLYGRHPSGREYAWVGDAEPLTHGWSEVPVVAATALSDFRSEAIALSRAGWRWPIALQCGQEVWRPDGGSVSELMTDLFGLFSDSSSRDRLAVAAEFLGSAVRGMRNNTLAATVSCLVLSGYSDRQIVMALARGLVAYYRQRRSGASAVAHNSARHPSADGSARSARFDPSKISMPNSMAAGGCSIEAPSDNTSIRKARRSSSASTPSGSSNAPADNRILSWQFAVLNAETGKGVIYTYPA